jgi:hypothetical protein
MKIKIPILIIAISLILTPSFFSCSETQVEDEYISFAETAAENYLLSINNNDYESFSKDLSKEMIEAIPEDEFKKLSERFEKTIGNYIEDSKSIVAAERKSGYIVIIFNLKYTDEPDEVRFTMTLQKINGEIQIAGSWFDSPKLRNE